MDTANPTPAPSETAIAPVATTAPALETIQLTRKYGALTALDGLSLTLEPGDVFGFIGPNGAGKSTTMKILAGLLEPSSGEARIMGKRVAEHGDFVRRHVGYMPDSFGVYEDLKVTEYLEFFASAYGVARKQRRQVVQQVLELTDLVYKKDALVDSLSRGMQQRLGLARVLVHDPPVLLLDEPASGLDPRARIEIRELLRELQRLGKTILISSHILSELGEFCNKLGIIERGKLLVAGTIDDLVARARVHPIICVEVVSRIDEAEALIRANPHVERVTREGQQLHVTLQSSQTHHHFLIELLLSNGFQLQSITPEQLKLEDVFLRVTKGLVQ